MEEQKLGVKATEQKLSVGDGFIGMLNAFVDPAGAAKRVPAPLSWLWPVITLSIIYVVFGYLMLPYTLALVDLRMNQQMSQNNAPSSRLSARRNITHMIYQFLPLATPVIVIVLLLLFAWLVSAMGSMAGLRAKFRDIFSLMAACALIPALQVIATYIVLHAKGDEITVAGAAHAALRTRHLSAGHSRRTVRAGEFLLDFRDLVSDRAHVRPGLFGQINQGQSVLRDHAGVGAAAGVAGGTGDGAGKCGRLIPRRGLSFPADVGESVM